MYSTLKEGREQLGCRKDLDPRSKRLMLGPYSAAAERQLQSAPDVMGMQESLGLLSLSRQLNAKRHRLSAELRQ